MTSQRPIITFDVTVRSAAAPAAVYALLVDPATHLEWAGEQAPNQAFRLLTLEATGEPVTVGTTFVSTGAAAKSGAMTFHDTSTVTEAEAVKPFETTPHRLVCMSASGVGSLIQAATGSLGGTGGWEKRCGLAA
ncbi:MAG TPA: hypothetical protein VM388_11910, partial [Acidimicrobiales bacterium]|nr:hypothetical protein [Acidimicrobiales bacterium]